MTGASRNAQVLQVNVSYEDKLNASHGYKGTTLHVSNDHFETIIDAIQGEKKTQMFDYSQLPGCANKQKKQAYSCDSRKLPGLVLAVVGDSESFVPKPWNTIAFTSGLMETVKGTKQCWIVYRGKQDGISELIQNTFKDDLGENQNDKDEKTSLIALQPLTEQTQEDPEKQINECLFCLEPKFTAHKDKQEEYKWYNKYLAQFLSHLSKQSTTLLSKKEKHDKPDKHDKHTQSEDTDLLKMKVPVLLVVAEGDIATIHQVKSAVSNNVPVLIVKGSGKASNFIAEYLNTSEKKKMLIAKAPLLLGIYIRRDVFSKLEKTMEKIEKYHYLITVFDVDNTDNAKMEDAVVEAIIKGWSLKELNDTDRSSSDLTKPAVVIPESSNNNFDQVIIAEYRERTVLKTITSNVVEVVDVVDDKDHEPISDFSQINLLIELQLLLLEALIADRVDYASAILQSGVKFNRDHKETLYDETLVCHDCNGKDCRNIHAIHIRVCKESGRKIWCTCKSDCKMEKREPDNHRQCFFGSCLCNSIAPDEMEAIKSCSCIRHHSLKVKSSFTEAQYLCQELLNYPKPHKGCLGLCDKVKKENETTDESTFHDLLAWALFANRKELAGLFWAKCRNQLLTAVMASSILKNMAENVEAAKDLKLHEELQQHSKHEVENEMAYVFLGSATTSGLTKNWIICYINSMNNRVKKLCKTYKWHKNDTRHIDDYIYNTLFEERVLEMQTTLYEEKENECMSLMMAEDNIWGIEVSPVVCAYDNKLMDVIGHPCVQRKLNKIWYNDSAVKWTEWMKSICGCNGARNCGKAWKAPIAMFSIHYMFVMAVLFVFSAFILTDIQHLSSVKSIGVYEWLLYIWLLGDVVEEVVRNIVILVYAALKNEQRGHKSYTGLKNYVSNIWNWMTVLCYIMIGGGIVVRVMNLPANTRMLIRFYSFGLFLLYMRFLQSMLVIHYFGPKIIMILKMLKELVNIGWLLLVFIACTGVLYHANMYPSHYDMWSLHGPTYWRIWKIIALPYWQIYGELFLEEIQGDNNSNGTCTFVREEWESNPEIERCVEYDWSLMIIAAFYMLITNLLLVNLVIALFTYRFEEVQQNSDRFWKYTRCSIITDYTTRFPVPFNLVIRIPYLIYAMRCCKTDKKKEDHMIKIQPLHAAKCLYKQMTMKK